MNLQSVAIGVCCGLLLSVPLQISCILAHQNHEHAIYQSIFTTFGDERYEVDSWEHVRDRDGVRTVVVWRRRP